MKTTRRDFNRRTVQLLAPAALLSVRGAQAQNVYDARIVRMTVDKKMTPGKKYRGDILVRNVGNLRWSGSDFYVLVENVKSPTGAKAQEDDFRFESKIGEDILPNQQVTLSGDLIAPRRAGEWTLRATMMRKREKFGDPMDVEVIVTNDLDATIELVRMGKLLKPKDYADITVRVRNKGEAIWTPQEVDLMVDVSKVISGRLSTLKDDWLVHVPLKAAVDTGKTVDLRFKIYPRNAGKMVLRFAMWDKAAKDTFGEEEPVEITVA